MKITTLNNLVRYVDICVLLGAELRAIMAIKQHAITNEAFTLKDENLTRLLYIASALIALYAPQATRVLFARIRASKLSCISAKKGIALLGI